VLIGVNSWLVFSKDLKKRQLFFDFNAAVLFQREEGFFETKATAVAG
jgi:hypothetical protein